MDNNINETNLLRRKCKVKLTIVWYKFISLLILSKAINLFVIFAGIAVAILTVIYKFYPYDILIVIIGILGVALSSGKILTTSLRLSDKVKSYNDLITDYEKIIRELNRIEVYNSGNKKEKIKELFDKYDQLSVLLVDQLLKNKDTELQEV